MSLDSATLQSFRQFRSDPKLAASDAVSRLHRGQMGFSNLRAEQLRNPSGWFRSFVMTRMPGIANNRMVRVNSLYSAVQRIAWVEDKSLLKYPGTGLQVRSRTAKQVERRRIVRHKRLL